MPIDSKDPFGQIFIRISDFTEVFNEQIRVNDIILFNGTTPNLCIFVLHYPNVSYQSSTSTENGEFKATGAGEDGGLQEASSRRTKRKRKVSARRLPR